MKLKINFQFKIKIIINKVFKMKNNSNKNNLQIQWIIYLMNPIKINSIINKVCKVSEKISKNRQNKTQLNKIKK